MTPDNPSDQSVGRKHPARGVRIDLGQPTIVFLTVNTRHRLRWMSQTPVQRALEDIWRAADAWLVGYYILMPDHLHLFCAPRDLRFALQAWVKYRKSQFRRRYLGEPWEWQDDFWDTRLRRSENYQEKWLYVQENPVRKGLVKKPEDWPYQGMLNVLPW
jgi:putative transposase